MPGTFKQLFCGQTEYINNVPRSFCKIHREMQVEKWIVAIGISLPYPELNVSRNFKFSANVFSNIFVDGIVAD
jgi:hypothetical protein